jgi:hypothetical protein
MSRLILPRQFIRPSLRHLKALFGVLVPLFVAFVCVRSDAGSVTRPKAAFVSALKGTVGLRPTEASETTTSVPVYQGQVIQIQRENEHVLLVPQSSSGDEHWVHFSFKGKTAAPLVQAGTDSRDSEYLFPCRYAQGTLVIGWGTRRVGSNCKQLTVASRGWRQKHLQLSKTAKPALMAQSNADDLTLEASNRLNLIYINQAGGNTVVNVLVGSVKVRSTTQTTVIGAGIQYIDTGDGSRGATKPIPKEVYDSRPVQIFLDPNSWSEEVRGQITDFQQAIDQQKSRPVGSDPSVPWIPEPTNPSDPPFDPRPRPAPVETPKPSPSVTPSPYRPRPAPVETPKPSPSVTPSPSPPR